ncbi:hypothetical protein [Actinosynnema sp. NPDC020468]|uniref:NACHT N-terminal Helical domain 1-containing protein n=1 Tax=Actinosynnema sp. NPDC020468 TaxID=3154488 RepID=UPI0034111F33
MPGVGAGLAKVAIAVALAGPVGAAQELGNQVVDRFWKDRVAGRPTVAKALRVVGAAVEEVARAEGVPADVVSRAVRHGSEVVAAHGLTAAELVAVDLDPDRAVALVLRRADRVLAGLGEPDEAVTRRLVREAYGAVVAVSADLPELVREYQREVLARLGSAPEDTRRVLLRSAAHALISDPGRRWRADRFPVSALLRAEYAVVPFWGRAALLDDLTGWAVDGGDVAARLYTAGGGMGKTRLLIELCRRLRAGGWRAGFLRPDAVPVTGEVVEHLARDVEGALIVVDYAETRQREVGRLVDAALAAGSRVRVVLLARAAADWWYQLRQLPDAVGDFLAGPAVTTHAVPPLATEATDRAAVFESAVEAYTQALRRDTAPGSAPPNRNTARGAGTPGPGAATPGWDTVPGAGARDLTTAPSAGTPGRPSAPGTGTPGPDTPSDAATPDPDSAPNAGTRDLTTAPSADTPGQNSAPGTGTPSPNTPSDAATPDPDSAANAGTPEPTTAPSSGAAVRNSAPGAGTPSLASVSGALAGATYDRVLFLHLRALAAVEGAALGGPGELLDFAVRREQRFWDDGVRAAGLPDLAGRPVRQAAALATLAGFAASADDATALLRRAPLLADQPVASVAKVAELLHRTYPAEVWLAGVQPDLLGEHLLDLVLTEEPSLLAALRA